MNTSYGTYSRDTLRALPGVKRKEHLMQYVHNQGYVTRILGAAQNGETSLMIEINDPNHMRGRGIVLPGQLLKWQTQPTDDEIRETLQELFPDSKIIYEEKWIQTAPGKQELKKGITVDWS